MEGTTDWQDGVLQVVVNDERFCSIWPLTRVLPPGWAKVGPEGTKADCLAFIRVNCDGFGRLNDATAPSEGG